MPDRARHRLPAVLGWLIFLVLGGIAAKLMWDRIDDLRGAEKVVWKNPLAGALAAGAALVGWAAFHLRHQRSASFAYSRVRDLTQTRTGAIDLLVGLPGALRMVSIVAMAVALARPQTYRIETKEIDSIDIMLVFDLSKSMEETDLQRDRLDAAQRVVRKFIKKVKNDRVGLVVFAQRTMLQCPMTTDMKVLDRIVAEMQLGDIPEYGTAIGDGLGLAIAQLKRSDAKSKVVILLSDGDSNVAEHFSPDEAARLARDQKIKVFTVLLGSENTGIFGGMSVNPATMRNIADTTGGQFFRAEDQDKFEESFRQVRETLDKTKRVEKQKVPDKELFWSFLLLAAAAYAFEQALALTRFRRFP